MEKFFKHPRWIVAVVAIITVFFALQITRAQLDNNNFRFTPKDDPEFVMMNKIHKQFGSEIVILVGLERKHSTVLEGDFLNKVRNVVAKIKESNIVSDVTSLVSTDYITGTGDSIVSEALVPADFTGTKEEIAALKDKLLSWDMYNKALVSDDFSAMQILIALDVEPIKAGAPEIMVLHHTIKKMVADEGFKDTNVYITGIPVFNAVVNEATRHDLILLVPLVVLVVVGVLFFSFRRLGGILLPLLTVLVSVIWSVGAMPLFGVKLTIISTILPVILVAVGSAYGIHIVSHYYDRMASEGKISNEEHRALVFGILRKIGRPVFLAALTTFAGFVSFCVTKAVPIFEFGLFSSFGVIIAFIIAVTLVPALILIRGPAKKIQRKKAAAQQDTSEDRLSTTIADMFMRLTSKKWRIIIVAGLVLAMSAFGIARLKIDNVLVEYFKPHTDIVKSDVFIRKYFGGSKAISLIVSSPVPGEVLRPDVLAAMDGLSDYLRAKVPEVGKTSGFTDIIKRINQVFNVDENPEGFATAASPAPALAGIANAGVANSGGGIANAGAANSGGGAASSASGAATPQAAADSGSFGFGFDSVSSPAEHNAGKDAGLSGTAGGPPPQAAADNDGRATAITGIAMTALLNKVYSEKGDRAMTAGDLVQQLSRAMNYRGAAYYEIPTNPAKYGKKDMAELKALIGNYLVFAGNVSGFADDPLEPKSVRMVIQLKTVGQLDTNRAVNAINDYVAACFPKDVKVELGGATEVEKSLNHLVVLSQMSSVVLSLCMVFLIMAVYYRSAIAGLIALAPLSISIIINFAIMGFVGIKLNIGTAMVASIAVGIGIDYTIHYMAAYHHEYLITKGTGDFLRRTFLTSGKAIIFNAISVGLGFAVLGLSQFNILADFGLLITLTMGTSALVSLTVLPVMLIMIDPAFIKKPLPSDKAVVP